MCIRDFYGEVLGVQDTGLLEILDAKTQIRHFKKGELLVREGSDPVEFHFLLQGVMRGFFIDPDGHDITDCIVFQCGSPLAANFELGAPAAMSVEALTVCDTLLLPVTVVEDLVQRYPELLTVYNRFLRQSLQYHWQAKKVLYQCCAMQRYEWFLMTFPELENVVKSKHIASFLGITPVTLSRLRRMRKER